MAVILGLLVLTGCGARATGDTGLRSQSGFGFDIVDLQTDHQFPGQRNTFHVSYEYRDGLQGAGYDPQGHPVSADVYPYFQDIRNEMIGFVHDYRDRSDFYEVFTENVARDVMDKYPQLVSIDLRVDVPAYGGVPVARTSTVHVERQ